MFHKIFDLHFFHVSNPFGLLINRPKYFRIRFKFRLDIRSQSLKNSTLRCAWYSGAQILGLAIKKKFLHIFSFMIDMFTVQCSLLKEFLLIVPLKATRDSKRFRFWLLGVMHTAESDSVVWCTLRRLTLQDDAHCGAWLRGGMHTVELF